MLRTHTGLLLTTWLAAQGGKPAKGPRKALKPEANEDSDDDGVSSQLEAVSGCNFMVIL